MRAFSSVVWESKHPAWTFYRIRWGSLSDQHAKARGLDRRTVYLAWTGHGWQENLTHLALRNESSRFLFTSSQAISDADGWQKCRSLLASENNCWSHMNRDFVSRNNSTEHLCPPARC